MDNDKESAPYCKCGCGARVVWCISKKNWNTYIKGHHFHHKEYREKISAKQKQRYEDPALREHARKKAIEAYQKDATLKSRIGQATKQRCEDPEYRKRVGRAVSKAYDDKPELREKARQLIKERYEGNPQLRHYHTMLVRRAHRTPEYRQKRREIFLHKWQESGFRNKILSGNSPSRPNSLEDLINSLTPDIVRYTGNKAWHKGLKIQDENGDWITKYKNPDFKITGQNKVIEVFGDYWHKDDDPNVWHEAWERAGFELLVIWEHEIYESIPDVLDRIATFIGQDDWQYSLPLDNPSVLKKIKE